MFPQFLCVVMCLLCSLVASSTVPLYVQPFASESVFEKGYLNLESGYSTYSPFEDAEFYAGLGCIGIKDEQGKFQCLAFGDIMPASTEEYVVHLNDHGSIEHIDYSRTPGISGVSDSLVKVISNVPKGPEIQFKAPITLVNNEVPAEELPKSFLQKYWMIILPLAIMFLTSGGGGGQ